jgi:hypothetical protein
MTARVRPGQIDLFTKRVRRPPAAPEFALHCMVADALRRWGMPDWRWTHLPFGEERPAQWVTDKDGKTRRRSFAGERLKRMGLNPGWLDLELISPQGRPHFLELKKRGGDLSDPQREFAAWCTAHDVPWFCTDRFDEALKILQAWGAVQSKVSVSV